MPRMIFPNLPVTDLDKTRAFWTGLGFSFDDRFCDGNAICLVLNDLASAMLLRREFFATFTTREVAEPGGPVGSILAVLQDSREDVDRLVDAALEAGASPVKDANDLGFMYGRAFTDLDGHQWEFFWMDPASVPPAEGEA
ncbi:MAG: VOC family protein [Kineosporiaceae bacterium]